jgi:hypothetical protein
VAGILILGMHRGGTSALARVVNLLGPRIGDTDDLMPAAAENRSGFWEIESLSQFNEELILHLGGRWSGPPVIADDALRRLAAGTWGRRASELFSRVLPDDGWVWKDPRACLLLPFWREVLDVDLIAVHAVRDPTEVAASLLRRNSFLEGYSIALWERYHRAALRGAAGLPSYLVRFDELLAQPADTVGHLRSWLADSGVALGGAAAVEAAVASLSASDRHHDLHDADLLTADQTVLFEMFAASGPVEGMTPAVETPGIQLAFNEHHHLGDVRDLADQMRAGLEEQKQASAELLAASRADAAAAWIEVRRLEAELVDALKGRLAVVEALEDTISDRDGWKWTVLQYENRRAARVRRRVRTLMVGEES